MTGNTRLAHGFVHEEQALPKCCKALPAGGGHLAIEDRGAGDISETGREDRLLDITLGSREDRYFEILCGCPVNDWNDLTALMREREEFDLNYGAGEFCDPDDHCLDWFSG